MDGGGGRMLTKELPGAVVNFFFFLVLELVPMLLFDCVSEVRLATLSSALDCRRCSTAAVVFPSC